ncbi:unnamed protein product, partial [marine sediment metagenome]
PGTGSRFTMDFIVSCLGYEKLLPKDLTYKPRYKPKHTPFVSLQHVNAKPQTLRHLAKHEGLKVVIPLRAPVHQFLSRAAANGAQRAKEESTALWKVLKEVKDNFDHVFLPIEEDMDRAGRLMLVANHLDAIPNGDVFEEIVTNWAKVGSNGVKPLRVEYNKTGNVSVGGFDMSFLDEEMAWYAGLIEEYAAGVTTKNLRF